MKKSCWLVPAVVLCAATCMAHDAWLQTNTHIVRTLDAIHIDLMLGNHGNDHRDFKLAGKLGLDGSTCELLAPDGRRLDLKGQLVDTGYAPQEGFWTARFLPAESGLYAVGHLSDQVMSYGPVRSIRGAKVYFVTSESLDRVSHDNPGFDRPLGHPLELVPLVNPVVPMGPGTPIRVRLDYKHKPLADVRVSFIPRGHKLADSFDETYEQTTDERGEAAFTPKFGTYYLIVAHHVEPQERGKGYDRTKYSATLCIYVPQICACCIE